MPGSTNIFGREPVVEKKQAIHGVNVWHNNSNGVSVLEIHYSADPDKNPKTQKGRAWLKEASSKYARGTKSREWKQEMEIDYSIPSGRPVHPNWDPALHESETFDYDPGLVVMRGWDFGRWPAVTWLQIPMIGPLRVVRVFDMIIGDDVDFDYFFPRVMEHQAAIFGPDALYNDFPDPAGKGRRTIEDKYGYKSDLEILENAHRIWPDLVNYAIKPIYRHAVGFREGIEIINALTRVVGDPPQAQIQAHPRAEVFKKGMRGMFHYPEPKDPTKVSDMDVFENIFKHGYDSFKYIMVNKFDRTTMKYQAHPSEELRLIRGEVEISASLPDRKSRYRI